VANLTLVFSDAVLALFIWGIACLVRTLWAPGHLPGFVVLSIVPMVLIWVILRATQGLYPGYGLDQAEELRRQTYALLAALAGATIFAFAFQIGDTVSRFLLGIVFLGLLLLSPLMRQLVKTWMAKHGVWGKPVIIVGSRESGARLRELLEREWGLGYRPAAVFDSNLDARLGTVIEGSEEMPHGSILEEAVSLSRKHWMDTVLLTMPQVPREYVANLANLASVHFRNVVIIPDLVGVTSSAAVARDFAGTLGVEVRHSLLDP